MADSDDFEDFYAILGLAPGADDGQITSAYRAKARILHPDKNRDDPHAATKFGAAKRARDVLLDPTERAAFDGVLSRRSLAKAREDREGEDRRIMREHLRAKEASASQAVQQAAKKRAAADSAAAEARAGLRAFKLALARRRRGEAPDGTPLAPTTPAAVSPFPGGAARGAFEDDTAFSSLPLDEQEQEVLRRLERLAEQDAAAGTRTTLSADVPSRFAESLSRATSASVASSSSSSSKAI